MYCRPRLSPPFLILSYWLLHVQSFSIKSISCQNCSQVHAYYIIYMMAKVKEKLPWRVFLFTMINKNCRVKDQTRTSLFYLILFQTRSLPPSRAQESWLFSSSHTYKNSTQKSGNLNSKCSTQKTITHLARGPLWESV